MKLLKQGSVKDIFQSENPDQLIFRFTDKYSVFDWGEMPDHIPHKGKCLAQLGAFFFKQLKNVSHHFIEEKENELLVKRVNILGPQFRAGKYDYSAYEARPHSTLIPLEVVFRLGIPQGSSLPSRLTADYQKELGLKQKLSEGDWLENPLVEFSTKLEPSDRYLSFQEAQKISGCDNLDELKKLTCDLAEQLFTLFQSYGVTLWDGKFEFAFDENRNFMLVDSLGPDELRLTYKDFALSKEFFRQYYMATEWKKNMDEAKQQAPLEWKKYYFENFKSQPPVLPSDYKRIGSQIYQTLCQELGVSQEGWSLDQLYQEAQACH